MPTTTKPRKPYRPRAVVTPLNMRDAWKIVGDTHAALIALEARAYDENHQHGLVAFADICRRIAPDGTPEHIQAKSLLSVLLNVQRRYLASSRLQVMALEEISLRTACAELIGWLQAQPNRAILRASVQSLIELERLGGIRL